MINPSLSVVQSTDCSNILLQDNSTITSPSFKENVTCRSAAIYDMGGNLLFSAGKVKLYSVGINSSYTIAVNDIVGVTINGVVLNYKVLAQDIVTANAYTDAPTALSLTRLNVINGIASVIASQAGWPGNFFYSYSVIPNTNVLQIYAIASGLDFFVSSNNTNRITVSLDQRVECSFSYKKRFLYDTSTLPNTFTVNSLIINAVPNNFSPILSINGTSQLDALSQLVYQLNQSLQVGVWYLDTSTNDIFIDSSFELSTLSINSSAINLTPIVSVLNDSTNLLYVPIPYDGVFNYNYLITEIAPKYFVAKIPSIPTTGNSIPAAQPTFLTISSSSLFGSSQVRIDFPLNGSAIEYANNIASTLSFLAFNTLKFKAGEIQFFAVGAYVYVYVSEQYLLSRSISPSSISINTTWTNNSTTNTQTWDIITYPSVPSVNKVWVQNGYILNLCNANNKFAFIVNKEANSCAPEDVCMTEASRLDTLIQAASISISKGDAKTAASIVKIINREFFSTSGCINC